MFWLAALAAPVFWAGLALLTHPSIDPYWTLREPRRFALVALGYPVLEEIAFRGLLQEWLRERWPNLAPRAGITGANLLTSALFSAAHVFAHPLPWALAVFVPSLVFGYFKDKSGTLSPGIVLHVFYNAGYFLIFWNPR